MKNFYALLHVHSWHARNLKAQVLALNNVERWTQCCTRWLSNEKFWFDIIDRDIIDRLRTRARYIDTMLNIGRARRPVGNTAPTALQLSRYHYHEKLCCSGAPTRKRSWTGRPFKRSHEFIRTVMWHGFLKNFCEKKKKVRSGKGVLNLHCNIVYLRLCYRDVM